MKNKEISKETVDVQPISFGTVRSVPVRCQRSQPLWFQAWRSA